MTTMKNICVWLTLAVCIGLLGACSPAPDDAGVVARVNGSPITLEELEVLYDLKKLSTTTESPTVASLKAEYGSILSHMIVRELVRQELEARGLAVTAQELTEAEEEIRADYPEGAFEDVLVEEYIDLGSWRHQLASRLTMEKFFTDVLRPGISLDYTEAEAYYREHIKDFFLPTRVRFHLVGGTSREVVENAVAFYRKSGKIDQLRNKFERVWTREIKVRTDRLTVSWKSALKGLKPGEVSGVIAGDRGFEVLIFEEELPEKVLPASQAYPIVERVLLDAKLQDAFDQWLQQAVSSASITVTPLLETFEQSGQTQGQEEQMTEPAAKTTNSTTS